MKQSKHAHKLPAHPPTPSDANATIANASASSSCAHAYEPSRAHYPQPKPPQAAGWQQHGVACSNIGQHLGEATTTFVSVLNTQSTPCANRPTQAQNHKSNFFCMLLMCVCVSCKYIENRSVGFACVIPMSTPSEYACFADPRRFLVTLSDDVVPSVCYCVRRAHHYLHVCMMWRTKPEAVRLCVQFALHSQLYSLHPTTMRLLSTQHWRPKRTTERPNKRTDAPEKTARARAASTYFCVCAA